MALFGKKKAAEGEVPPAAAEAPTKTPERDPAKAGPWCDRARTVHEASNYEYAATCWLQGLRFDPGNTDTLAAFYESAQAFLTTRKKPGPSKDQAANVGGRGVIDRYLAALLEFGTRPLDAKHAVRALELAVKLDEPEAAYWLGEKAFAAAGREAKPKKETYVRMMDLLAQIEAFDLASKAGDTALRLDPSDGPLQDKAKNLAAQATMSRGGFDETGEAGGFRKNIRDSQKLREIAESESIVKSEDAATRNVVSAKEDYEGRPTDTNSVMRYVRALRERGRPEDEKTAFEILMQAFEKTNQFRFRQEAGELRMRQAKRKLRALAAEAQAKPDDKALAAKLAKGQEAIAQMELEEYALRVKNYPTDLSLKYELAKRLIAVGRDEEAIPLLQHAQHDSKHRTAALLFLGQAFTKMGLDTEAIDTYRNALSKIESDASEIGTLLRYGLMGALHHKAEQERDREAAEEALKLASSIMMQQFDYKDIRQRRESLQDLVKQLKAA